MARICTPLRTVAVAPWRNRAVQHAGHSPVEAEQFAPGISFAGGLGAWESSVRPAASKPQAFGQTPPVSPQGPARLNVGIE
jgi:hypothetical protein